MEWIGNSNGIFARWIGNSNGIFARCLWERTPGANAVDLSCLFQFPLPVGLPFIGRLFVDAGARRSLRLRLVVFDLANGVQQFLQDDYGFFGMCGGQQGGFAREAHEGVLELRPDGTLRG